MSYLFLFYMLVFKCKINILYIILELIFCFLDLDFDKKAKQTLIGVYEWNITLSPGGANFTNRLKLRQLSLCIRFKPKNKLKSLCEIGP